MNQRLHTRILVVLAVLLGAALVVELLVSALRGEWELNPLHPAVLSSVTHQLATMTPEVRGRRRPSSTVVVLAGALTLVSAVVVWPAAGVGDRTAAAGATVVAAFFVVDVLRRRHGAPPAATSPAPATHDPAPRR